MQASGVQQSDSATLSVCFSDFYHVVLVFTIQQCTSATVIHTSPPSLAALPSPHPIPPGDHRAPDWTPCATQQLFTS